jgi:protein O-mannosyl-transferase
LISKLEFNDTPSRRLRVLRGAVLAFSALITLAAYWRGLDAPFVFDDLPAIQHNPSIRSFATALTPPTSEGNTVGGRPLLNLTFAANHAVHGLNVWGYRATNIAIHLANGLLLVGILVRCFAADPTAHNRVQQGQAWGFAVVVTFIWWVHPLHTAAVTYVVQRAESLAAFFVLLSLYSFIRGAGLGVPAMRGDRASSSENWTSRERELRQKAVPLSARTARGWWALAIGASIAGVATKETASVAPLLVLMLDRAFVAGSFRAALRTRWMLYVGLSLSWVLAAYFVISAQGRGGSVGYELGISWTDYLRTQCLALVQYLRLTFWPADQVFDYGSPVVRSWAAAWPHALVIVVLLGVALWSAVKWPRVGTPAVAFFVLLAPSSSVVPVASQTIAEHRMYLPLACVLTVLTACLYAVRGVVRIVWLLPLLGLPLAYATTMRNEVYRTVEGLWRDTVKKRPENPRAQNNLGLVLAEAKQYEEAVIHFRRAIDLFPRNPDALNNLGRTLLSQGKAVEALGAFQEALALAPQHFAARVNYAEALASCGRAADAAREYEQLARGGRLDLEAQVNWGASLLRIGRLEEGTAKLKAVIEQAPNHARARFNLGNAYARSGQWLAAVEHYRAAVAASPDYAAAHANLGNALLMAGRPEEAISAYEEAVRLKPGDPVLRSNLQRAQAAARGIGR